MYNNTAMENKIYYATLLGVTEVCKWGLGFLKNKQFEITIHSRQIFSIG